MRAISILQKKKTLSILVILFTAFIFTFMTGAMINHDVLRTDLPFAKDEDRLNLSPYVEGEVLVIFKKGVDILSIDNIVDSLYIDVKKYYSAVSRVQGRVYVLLKSETQSTQQMQAELANLAQVADVSPNYKVTADTTIPNDPRFNELWGLHNTGQTGGTADVDIDAPEAWDNTTWTTTGTVGNIKIEYSVNNGENWLEIVSSTTNDGSYSWTVPETASESARVRVSEVNGLISDQSDNVFFLTVLPTITFTSPNDGSYEWTVPEITSVTCLIRVSDAAGDCSDESDAVFSIVNEGSNVGKHGDTYEDTPTGRVKIAGVEITFTIMDGTRTKRIITNQNGYYLIALKGLEYYSVTAKHPDFHDYSSYPDYTFVIGVGYGQYDIKMTRK